MKNKQWRTKTEMPTESGWYFARRHRYDKEIHPVYIRVYKNGRSTINHIGYYGPASDYDWFGPVDEVVEVPCNSSS